MKAYDIIGYVYRADIYCRWCIMVEVDAHLGDGDEETMTGETDPEAYLDKMAYSCKINRYDEISFDSDEFPKVIFASQYEGDICGRCRTPLLEPADHDHDDYAEDWEIERAENRYEKDMKGH